jgi:hypothetical protein
MRKNYWVFVLLFFTGLFALDAQSVTFYAYGPTRNGPSGTSVTGHAFVSINNGHGITYVRGFHPDEWGSIKDDSNCVPFATDSYTIGLTSSQYNRVIEVVNTWSNKPPIYGWRDCVGFVQDIADAIGLVHGGWQTQLPTSIIKELRNKN